MHMTRRAFVYAAVVTAGCMLLVVDAAAGSAAATDGLLTEPQRWASATASAPRIPERAHGLVRVDVRLRMDPLGRSVARGAVARSARLSPRELKRLRATGDGGVIARRHERRRRHSLRALSPMARQAAVQQAVVVRAIVELGGHVTRSHLLGNTVRASLPAGAVRQLSTRAEVAAVEPAPLLTRQGMETTTAAVGAPSFWSLGLEGGRGTSDINSADYAIFDDKLQEDHPVFAEQSFQRPPGAGTGTVCGSAAGSECDHGTAVGSFAISGGCGPARGCSAGDVNELGVSPRPDTVLDADDEAPSCGGGIDVALWALGVDAYGTGSCSSTLIEGADDPAETASLSAGTFVPGVDDSSSTRITDAYLNLGLVEAVAAGNDGPAPSVATPCIAYNTLCTGGVDTHATADQSDDTVAEFSARGPTPAGRKKPDLAAAAVPEGYPNRRWNAVGQAMFTSGLEGTSFAAPQVAGAATLLVGSGITDPLAVKAVLINSARQVTPGWDPAWGWGELNLRAAVDERTNFSSGTAAPGDPRFYRATTRAAGERATLVWSRRTSGCIGPGCQPGELTFTNLDLSQATAQGVEEATSASTVDNVEQVRTTSGGYPREVIYKVRSASAVDGLPGEPFAITATRPLTPLVTPRPVVDLVTDRSAARPGDDIVVTAHVSNPSPDLEAHGTSVTLQLPQGAELAPGSSPATQSLGMLDANPGLQRSLQWTVRGNHEGTLNVSASATATALGENLIGRRGDVDVTIDGTPPAVTLSAPTGTTTSTFAALAWGAADLVGPVTSFDVERQVDDGPFATERSSTSETSAQLATPQGHHYRFRVRARDWLGNTSAYVTSGDLRVVEPPCDSCRPAPGAKRRPGLTIKRVQWTNRTVTVWGGLARGATKAPRVTITVRVAGRTRTVTRRARLTHGRWKATLHLPRSTPRARNARLVVRYVGNARFKAAALSQAVHR